MASIVGSGIYFAWYSLENKYPLLVFIGAALILLGLTPLLVLYPPFYIILIILPCVLGFRFHRKLNNETRPIWQSLILLFAVSGSAFSIGGLLMVIPGIYTKNVYLLYFHYFGLATLSPLTPFFIWAWKKFNFALKQTNI